MGGLKLVARDPNATSAKKPGEGITIKVPDNNPTFRGPASARGQQPSISLGQTTQPTLSPGQQQPSVSLGQTTPATTPIPGTGVKLVHGKDAGGGGGLKFVPRTAPTSPTSEPKMKKKDPLDDQLGPIALKMMPRKKDPLDDKLGPVLMPMVSRNQGK